MGPRPILKLDPNTSESIVSERNEPSESTSGSPADICHVSPTKAKPGPLPLPFSSCSQAQFLFLEHSPHVHFPPTPCLVRPGITHSSSTYDRAPIEVSLNQCELPARGCRVYEIGAGNGAIRSQMVYTPGPGRKPSSMIQPVEMNDGDIDSYFDPRAFKACRHNVARSGQKEDEGNVEHDREAHTLRSDSPCSSSPSSFEPESEQDESSYTQEISTLSPNHDSFIHPPSPTTRLKTVTLLPYPCSYPLQSVSSRLRKIRSTNSCGGTRGRRRKLLSTRSHSVDGVTYARWNLDINNGTNACKSLSDISISDPSLDGCLGGF